MGHTMQKQISEHIRSWMPIPNVFFLQTWKILYLLSELNMHCNIWEAFLVCVEVLQPSQTKGVMLSAVSLTNQTLLGRLSPLSG